MGLFTLCSIHRYEQRLQNLQVEFLHDPSHSSECLFLPCLHHLHHAARPRPAAAGRKGQASRRLAENRPVRTLRRTATRRAENNAAPVAAALPLQSLCADAKRPGPLRSFRGLVGACRVGLAAQKPGRISATYALDITAPRTARTRQFGAMERPLVELLARCRVIPRGLSPDKFCVSYGGTGGDLTLTLSDFSAS